MKYRKKPVVIDAWQIPPDDQVTRAIPMWVLSAVAQGVVIAVDAGGIDIKTLEGTMRGNVGDYLIKGTKDELYPCKPDIFESIYDSVPSDAGESK